MTNAQKLDRWQGGSGPSPAAEVEHSVDVPHEGISEEEVHFCVFTAAGLESRNTDGQRLRAIQSSGDIGQSRQVKRMNR